MKIIINKEKGAEGLVHGRITDSGYDAKCIGYAKITPVLEIINGEKVKVDGVIQDIKYFEDMEDKYVIVKPLEQIMLVTGLQIEIPEGCNAEDFWCGLEVQARGRSGLSLKMGLNVHLGTIDNEYRGSCNFIATNICEYPIKISYKERVGQLIFNSVIKFKSQEFEEVDTFTVETCRGAKGYGDSGK